MRKAISLIIAISFLLSSINIASAAELPFKDIGRHWAKENILALYDQEIVAGYPDNTYRPDNSITLIEFLRLATLGIGYKLESGHLLWYENYLNKALEIGLIDVKEYPDIMVTVSREQIAEIAVKAVLNVEEKPTQELDEMISMNIRDFALITDNRKQYVIDAYRIGLFAGNPEGFFNPQSTMTRAEMCAVILRLMDKTKRVPFDPKNNYAIKLNNIFSGDPYIIARPEKKEEIDLAHKMIEAQSKSKGWYFVSYYPDNIGSKFYESEQEFVNKESSHMSLTINLDKYDNKQGATYSFMVRKPEKVEELHILVVEEVLKHIFEQDYKKALYLFNNCLKDDLLGTAKPIDANYVIDNRRINIYRDGSTGFDFHIYKKVY